MVRRQDRSTIDTREWKLSIRPAIAHRANYRCECCGKFCGMHGHVDHIVPRSACAEALIDPRDKGNLQYLCPACHNAKSAQEKWSGHKRRDRTGEIRRSHVPGREAFQSALASAVDCKFSGLSGGK